MHIRVRRPRPLLAVAAAVALGLVLSACSSSGTSTSDTGKNSASAGASGGGTGLTQTQVADLTAKLDAARKTAQWKAPGPTIDVSSLKGKTIFGLVPAQTDPFQKQLADGIKEGAAAAGLKANVVDPGTAVTQYTQALDTAVAQHVAAIVLGTVNPDAVAQALTKAKAARIPVIASINGDATYRPAAQKEKFGVVANSSYCFTCAAQQIADEMILKTKGNMHVAFFQAPGGYPYSIDQLAGVRKEIATYCPKTCSVDVSTLVTSDIVQSVTASAQKAARDPKINLIYPDAEYQISIVLPVVKSAGAKDRIWMAGTNGNLAPMQAIAAGEQVIDVGNPTVWDGWGAIDAALRAILGTDVPVEAAPSRLFDSENIKSIDLKADPGTWYGSTDYRLEFKKLWGVSAA